MEDNILTKMILPDEGPAKREVAKCCGKIFFDNVLKKTTKN